MKMSRRHTSDLNLTSIVTDLEATVTNYGERSSGETFRANRL
jgi:hypothetical protein